MAGVAVATWVVRLVGAYCALGLAFAFPFVIRGVGRIDPDARHGTWGFRVLIVPGVVVLWPVLAWRWWSGSKIPPSERNAHRDRASAP